MVRPEEFESPTPWFVAKYSIQLSYGRVRLNYTLKQVARVTKLRVIGGGLVHCQLFSSLIPVNREDYREF